MRLITKEKGHRNFFHECNILVFRSVVNVLLCVYIFISCCMATIDAAVERFLIPLCVNKYPIFEVAPLLVQYPFQFFFCVLKC